MKSTKSTLSPHAKPFFLPRPPTFADVDRSVVSSSVNTRYSSPPFQPQVFNANLEDYYGGQYKGFINDEGAPTPVCTSSSQSYPSPNEKFTLSPCLTLKKLEIACDPTSKLSPDDSNWIDSPCYKGRNWSQTTPFHIGEMSAPRVTVKKLGEEHNLSVEITPTPMVSNEKEKGLSVAVPMGPLDSCPVGSSGGNSIKQKLDPGSSRVKMALQEIVDLSYMLLQIPSNAAKLAEGDDMKIEMIIEGLKKFLEKTERGSFRKLAKAYRLDNEKGKKEAHSASCSQKRVFEDNEATIEANLYKSLWKNAEIEKCQLKYKIQNARMVVDTGTNK